LFVLVNKLLYEINHSICLHSITCTLCRTFCFTSIDL
jgi:hypothetical protein